MSWYLYGFSALSRVMRMYRERSPTKKAKGMHLVAMIVDSLSMMSCTTDLLGG